MNKSVFIGLLLFSVGAQLGLQLYFSNRKTQVKEEQQKEALRLEVLFAEEREHKEETTSLSLPYAHMSFTNKGGSLSDLTYVRNMDGHLQEFVILATDDSKEREQQAFLVALDDKTPYAYELKGVEETDEMHTISYEHVGHGADIQKQFLVHKDKQQIDMVLTVKPHTATKVRLLWPSPVLKGLGEDEVLDGFALSQKGDFSKVTQKKIEGAQYSQPSLFGVEDKYFVYAMVSDAQNFAQRGYYKNVDQRLLAILESSEIQEETTWKFSFYCGPKQAAAMMLVDKRLEKVFDYGFFGFIAKPLLKLLAWVNGIVHNYGLAILLVTLLLKLILLPFTWSGARKMKRLQEYQRKMEYLQQKYKHDKQALEAARMELLQKEGVPLGGCLPALLPIPFLVALQSGLSNSLELYRAPFVFWIKDLSAADPYYVLPFLMTVFFLLSGAMGGKSARQNIGAFIMAIVMFAFTSSLAAGLCLCIVANIGLHVLQTALQKAIDV